jgi:hypothetical protein
MQRDDNSEDKNMYVAICRSDVRNLLVGLVWFLAFNATFNSISVISWQSFFKPQDQLEPNLVQCRNVHWMVLTVITEKRPNEAKFSVFIWV